MCLSPLPLRWRNCSPTRVSRVGGAHTDGHHASGAWGTESLSTHINTLETEVLELALRGLLPVLPRGHVRVRSDNATVSAYISHQGGTVSNSLSTLTESILSWADSKGVTLSAVHVQGKANILADLLSMPDTISQAEWTLVHQALTPVWERFGKPWVVLFATTYSARLPSYVPPVPDPQAWGVDALSLHWRGLDAYRFPPFTLIHRVLRKWEQEQPRLILLAPDWPAQGWYPSLLQLAQDKLPLALGPRSVVQPRADAPHGNVEMLKLTAWRGTVAAVLRASGASDWTRSLVQDAHRSSTKSVYSSHWRAWYQWGSAQGRDPLRLSHIQLANHLSSAAVDPGMSAAALRVRRAAVLTTCRQVDPTHEAPLATTSDVIRAVARRRARTKVRIPSWT